MGSGVQDHSEPSHPLLIPVYKWRLLVCVCAIRSIGKVCVESLPTLSSFVSVFHYVSGPFGELGGPSMWLSDLQLFLVWLFASV